MKYEDDTELLKAFKEEGEIMDELYGNDYFTTVVSEYLAECYNLKTICPKEFSIPYYIRMDGKQHEYIGVVYYYFFLFILKCKRLI